MNLVLHRAQVALNINEFDITEQVAEQINQLLPTATISPDGVSPVAAAAAAASSNAPAAQPANAAPTSPPPAPPPTPPAAGPRR